MTPFKHSNAGPAHRRTVAGVALALAALPAAQAFETSASGRLTLGTVERAEANDPNLLTALNAAELGLHGLGNGGNADDANTNYRRGDVVSRSVKGYLDLSAREGGFTALLRVMAWRDAGLIHDARAWGNVPSDYTAGQPLSDRGAPSLTRFSGVAVADAWVEQRLRLGALPALLRVGQQTLDWGTRTGLPGGLEAINAKNLPALHRAGAAPQEIKVPAPMLFGRLALSSTLGVEGFWQARFRPTALDMCGSLWSPSDYITEGCDKVMAGMPLVSDRERVARGIYLKRLPTPRTGAHDAGLGLTWKTWVGDFGLYHARYVARTPMPGLRRSPRTGGPALIPGDPDGLNLAYFSEFPEGVRLTALTFSRKFERASVFGELSYRPNLPFMLAPGDVAPAFLSPSAPSLLRADANALAPGALFHGYDRYRLAQLQFGVQHEWSVLGVPLSASAEALVKHTAGLPDPALRRYGRADIFGVGPINGACPVTTGDAARQCSLAGYATPDAWAYRLRVDARLPSLLAGLAANAGLVFTHDVKGWSGDFLVNQGRRSANLGLRLEYRQRYLAELAWMPVWGGDYNPQADRDTVALSVGLKF
jgi:hypothetical protein